MIAARRVRFTAEGNQVCVFPVGAVHTAPMRCFIRLPSAQTKIIVIPPDATFEQFKKSCIAKLGLACDADTITIKLGSGAASVDLEAARQ